MNPLRAAGVIGGMFQGFKYLRPVWNRLADSETEALTNRWASEFDDWRTDSSVHSIIATIADHPELGKVWAQLNDESHEAAVEAIEIIATNVESSVR